MTNPRTFDVKKWPALDMHKCGMWKPDTANQRLLRGVPSIERQRKKYNIKGNIKPLLGKYCEIENIMKFLRR